MPEFRVPGRSGEFRRWQLRTRVTPVDEFRKLSARILQAELTNFELLRWVMMAPLRGAVAECGSRSAKSADGGLTDSV